MEKMDVLAALSGLAQETRLEIFRLLVTAGPAGLPAGEISETLGLAPATLSFHLNHLKQAGLASCRRESRSLIYVASFATSNALVGYLTENCCGGNAAACAPGICAAPAEQIQQPRTSS